MAAYDEDGDSPNPGMVALIQAWTSNRDDLGALVSIDSTRTVVVDSDTYEVQMNATFELRRQRWRWISSWKTANMWSGSGRFDPVFTMGEKLAQAGMNTLRGMGTVFLVLILISLIISCFKFIHIWKKSAKKRLNQRKSRSQRRQLWLRRKRKKISAMIWNWWQSSRRPSRLRKIPRRTAWWFVPYGANQINGKERKE